MLGDHKFRRTADSRKFFHMLEEKSISAFSVFELPGEKFTAQWILEHGLEHPIAINATAEDIGMKLPDRSLKVSDIAKIVGAHTQIKIIDVAQQSEINGWTFGAYAEYLENRTNAHKVLNLISLEISRTPLAKQIQGPTAMRKMDWIDVMWPLSRRARGDFPQVQKYLLTGMAESYTDFHLDFGVCLICTLLNSYCYFVLMFYCCYLVGHQCVVSSIVGKETVLLHCTHTRKLENF